MITRTLYRLGSIAQQEWRGIVSPPENGTLTLTAPDEQILGAMIQFATNDGWRLVVPRRIGKNPRRKSSSA